MNFYKILGFSGPVSIDEIKTRYRELAKQYHPDINKEAGAEERFKLISNAYHHLLKNDIPYVKPTTKKPAAKKAKPQKTSKKKEKADQQIFRLIGWYSVDEVYETYFPDIFIPARTVFNFMFTDIVAKNGPNGNEFKVRFTEETKLPIKIRVNTPRGLMTIRISYFPAYS